LVTVVESGGFVCVGDGSGEDSDSGDARGVCESDTTDVVGSSRDLTGATGAVGVVEEFGSWERCVLVEVVGAFGVLEERDEGGGGKEDGRGRSRGDWRRKRSREERKSKVSSRGGMCSSRRAKRGKEEQVRARLGEMKLRNSRSYP